MEKRVIFVLAIIALAILVFFLSIRTFCGYLHSERNLGRELKTHSDSLYQYRLSEEPPFKYRVLFPSIINGSYNLLASDDSSTLFFQTFRFWSALFYVTSVIALFFLLQTLQFDEWLSFLGCAIFLLLPPMLMAFSLPVHTREDTLGYTILFTGLTFLARDKKWHFMVMAVIGAVTRETLLIMPLLYFFFVPDGNLIRKLFITGFPGVVWLSSRLLMGRDAYDVWLGMRWNLDNPEQVVGFLFLTFGVCWLPLLSQLFFYRRSRRAAPPELHLYYRSSVFILAVILLTTFFGGIFNEIRLLNLFFPWIIVIFLDYIRTNRYVLTKAMKERRYQIMSVIIMLAGVAVLSYAVRVGDSLIEKGKYAVRYGDWIIIAVVQIFIFLLFLPLWLRISFLKKPVK